LRGFVETPRRISTQQAASERILAVIDPVFAGDARYRAVFRIFWELRQFVEAELGGSWDIGPMLTLSGTIHRAFAATAEEYVKIIYQDYGVSVLKLIQDAMSGNRGENTSVHRMRRKITNTAF